MNSRKMFLYVLIAAFMLSVANSGMAEARYRRHKSNVKKAVVTGAAIGAAASILTGGNAGDTAGMAALGGAVGYLTAKVPKHRTADRQGSSRQGYARGPRVSYVAHPAYTQAAYTHHRRHHRRRHYRH